MRDEVRNILNSDLLERFVLGDINDAELRKVERLRAKSKEVRDTLNELELSIEQVAIDHQTRVPAHVKSNIIQKDYDLAPPSTKPKVPKLLIGYAAALLLGIGGTWFIQQPHITDLKTQLIEQDAHITILERDCGKINNQFAFINDKDTRPVVLQGTDYAPSSEVVIYWNIARQQCLLKVSNLPAIDADKTYQLWADVDGKMISLGTFDYLVSSRQPVAMQYLDDAESLNITIEQLGGSDHPNVTTLSAAVAI